MTASQATAIRIQHSPLQEADAVMNQRHPAGEPILFQIQQGQTLRIVDLEGNQAADVIFYSAADLAEHYSATDTLLRQGGIYLTTGSVLMSNEGRPMLTITADTCGRHDTLGGACAAERKYSVRPSGDQRGAVAALSEIASTRGRLGLRRSSSQIVPTPRLLAQSVARTL